MKLIRGLTLCHTASRKGFPIVIGWMEWSLIYGSLWRRAEPSGASNFHHADSSGSCGSRSPRFPSDDPDASWKNAAIAVESKCDCGAIEPQSRIIRRGITSTIIVWRSLEHQYHDRRTIVAQSRRDRGSFGSKIKAKLTIKLERSWSHDIAPRNRSHDASNQPPRPPLSPMNLGQFPP